jgi:hypothetical protein
MISIKESYVAIERATEYMQGFDPDFEVGLDLHILGYEVPNCPSTR